MNPFHIVEERFRELVDESAEFVTLAEGFKFTEGASWHPIERHVTFSDIPSSRLHRWFADSGETTVFRDPSNMTNGTTYDNDGCLLMCEHQTSQVTRLAHDGSVTVLADRWEGAELNSPNDIVVDDRGAIWFTDPLYGRQSHTGVPREPGLPFKGVFKINQHGVLEILDNDYEGPNGLCFSPAKNKLYVNDSERRSIRVYDVATDGSAAGGKVFAETKDDDGTLGTGSPDGMKVDAAGNIWCAGPGAFMCSMIAGYCSVYCEHHSSRPIFVLVATICVPFLCAREPR